MTELTATATVPFRILLDDAMRWVRRTARSIYWKLGLAMAALSAVTSVFQVVWIGQINRWQTDDTLLSDEPAIGCGIIFGFLLLALVQYVLYTTMGAVAVDSVAGREVDLRSRMLFAVTPRVFGTLLLAGFFMGLSYLCCLAPALYVVPLLSFTLPAMVDEDLFGMGALRRSARLARYNPQRNMIDNPLTKVFALLFVGVLLSVAVSLLVQLPVTLAQQWALLRDLGSGEQGTAAIPPVLLWLQVPASFVSGLFTAVVSLYLSFGIALLFEDTRRRKEGGDLEAVISALDEESAPRVEAPAPPAIEPGAAAPDLPEDGPLLPPPPKGES